MSCIRNRSAERPEKRTGFTLMEVILVMVVVVIISGIALPYFAGSYRGYKLRTSSRTISRMANYARSMSILREEVLTVVLNHETMELFLGAEPAATTNDTDGVIDQDVLKRLGYVEGNDSAHETAGLEKELHRFLPEGIHVKEFKKNWTEEDELQETLYLIRYFPNGQSEWFMMELEDQRGMGVKLENDPVSGRIISEFTQ